MKYLPAPISKDQEGSRLYDGRVERAGRFVVGGLNFKFGVGLTYSVSYSKEGELGVKTLDIPPVKCSNGICFSKNGRHMFHTDSFTYKINVFRYNSDGTVREPWLFK